MKPSITNVELSRRIIGAMRGTVPLLNKHNVRILKASAGMEVVTLQLEPCTQLAALFPRARLRSRSGQAYYEDYTEGTRVVWEVKK